MGNKNKPTYYQPIGEGEPPEGLKKKIEKMKKKKKKGYLGSPHKDETKWHTKASLGVGAGKKAAKKTKKYVKKLGKKFKEGFTEALGIGLKGYAANLGFIEEMMPKKKNKGGPVRYNKGGPVDARKIAKKYFKGVY